MTDIDYRLFLSSNTPEEILLAILSNFEPQDSAAVLTELLRKLNETATGPLLFERYLAQLRVLIQLRNLQPLFEAAMDNLAKYVNEQGDPFYVKGKNLGFILGTEQGIQEGILKGLQEGASRAQRQLVKNLLIGTDFTDDKIALLTSVSVGFVQEVRQNLDNE